MLARDDRAINVHVVLRRQQVTPGAVLGGSADDDLVPKMQVELANVVLVEAALVVEVDAEGLVRVLARAWTALQLTVTANLLPSMLLLAGWGGVGDKSSRGRWLRLCSYWKGGRAIASTLERPNSKLQAGARGVNGQRLAQDPSVDVMT